MELKEKKWTIILGPLLALIFGLIVGAIFLIFTKKTFSGLSTNPPGFSGK